MCTAFSKWVPRLCTFLVEFLSQWFGVNGILLFPLLSLIFSFKKKIVFLNFVLGYSWLTNNVVIVSGEEWRDSAIVYLYPDQIRSVTHLCLTLCDPMNCSTPGLPVHHQLPEFTQTHVHRVGDAIQPSHPLSSPSPPAPNPSQHQSLFQWVNSSHEVAKVLEFQL